MMRVIFDALGFLNVDGQTTEPKACIAH